MDSKRHIFKKFFKNSNNSHADAQPVKDAPIDTFPTSGTMPPSSPGFNPPKFSFARKKFDGKVSINGVDDEKGGSHIVDASSKAVKNNSAEGPGLDEEYPDELFDSLIADETKLLDSTEATEMIPTPQPLEPIEEESRQQCSQFTSQPMRPSKKNLQASVIDAKKPFDNFSSKAQIHHQLPRQGQSQVIHEPKPVSALNGNRLIVQLTSFATSLEEFKASVQQRQNALELAILGMDEKLGKPWKLI